MREPKKLFFPAAFLLLFLLPASFVHAQMGTETERPAQTGPASIAMIFYKLAAEAPDFRAWIARTKEYQNTPRFDQEELMEKRTEELKKIFNLISAQEPITLNTVVSLSPYNAVDQGFLVDALSEDMIFPVQHMGKKLGIIAKGISGVQWIAASPEMASAIWRQTQRGTRVQIELRLTPVAADNKQPVEYNGASYWPLLTEVESLRIWSDNGKKILWENNPHDPAKNKVKNLFYRGG